MCARDPEKRGRDTREKRGRDTQLRPLTGNRKLGRSTPYAVCSTQDRTRHTMHSPPMGRWPNAVSRGP